MEYILELKGITKKYGKKTVVHPSNLSMERGHIYGLIGPNGAGKTTIMKMLAGLAKPDGGSISLFGSEENLDEKRGRMSFMLEAPYLDGGMTAYQSMQYIRYIRGVADESRIDKILEYVGLSDVGKKKIKEYSLGMKQRLGIAMALLPSPEIMVLDEPVNGLDPEGIVDVRNMLKKLAKEENITILISSHLLAELSELCTDYAIIHEGHMVETLSAEELECKCKNYLAIRTNDIHRTVTVLEQQLGVKEYSVVEQEEIHLFEGIGDVEKVSKTITDSGLIITKLNPEGESLEDYYLGKVGGQNE